VVNNFIEKDFEIEGEPLIGLNKEHVEKSIYDLKKITQELNEMVDSIRPLVR